MTEHQLEEIHRFTKYKVVETLIKKHQEGNTLSSLDEVEEVAENVLDENLIMANVRDMSREELEQFADRMRIDRNSFLIQVQNLQTELYFCNRNNRIEEIVDERIKMETQ